MTIRLQRWGVPLLALVLSFGTMHDLHAQSDGNQKTINLRTRDGREYQLKFSKFSGIKCELHELKAFYRTGEVEEITVQNLVWPTNKTEGYYEQEVYKVESTDSVVVNVGEGAVITFGELSTDIHDTPANTQPAKTRIEIRSANRLHVYGMRATDHIAVYAIDGRKMNAAVSIDGEEADISLATLPVGVYVVKVNEGCTIKMQKR